MLGEKRERVVIAKEGHSVELLPGIHSIPAGADPFTGFYAPNVYLVMGKVGAMIDAGFGDDESIAARMEYVRSFTGLRLSYIVVTHAHPDHVGGAVRMREETGAQVVLHPLECEGAQSAGVTADRQVTEGDELDLDGFVFEFIHTPGHSPGHICIYIREEGVLFSGDHVLGIGTTAMRPPEGDMAQYIESLERLLSYDIRLICPGHGPPIRQARTKIEELIKHRLEREEQVLSGLARGKGTVEELVAEIYPELDHRLHEAAKGQVQAHLVKLERAGRAYPTGSEENARYALR